MQNTTIQYNTGMKERNERFARMDRRKTPACWMDELKAEVRPRPKNEPEKEKSKIKTQKEKIAAVKHWFGYENTEDNDTTEEDTENEENWTEIQRKNKNKEKIKKKNKEKRK